MMDDELFMIGSQNKVKDIQSQVLIDLNAKDI